MPKRATPRVNVSREDDAPSAAFMSHISLSLGPLRCVVRTRVPSGDSAGLSYRVVAAIVRTARPLRSTQASSDGVSGAFQSAIVPLLAAESGK